MYYKMDKEFMDYYGVNPEKNGSNKGSLRQVFFYLIDKCNLSCEQCLYKLEMAFQLTRQEIPLEEAKKLISDFREMGAEKLTLMGGEPTLYSGLLDLIEEAKRLGYEYVRIDTNGMFMSELLEDPKFKLLDEITFSLDGPIPEVNDPIRGKNSFEIAVKNIKRAKELGYNINITTCISKALIQRDENSELYLHRMIKLAEELGVERINFHNLFKTGVPRDHFSGNLDITIEDWFKVWKEIQKKIDLGEYSIPVRIPQSFTTKAEFREDPAYYSYCSVKNRTRILAHPNGMLRVCSLMIGTPYGIGRYYDDRIVWDKTPTNETLAHQMDMCTACTNQSKRNQFGDFVPLCVSFKPKQEEMIWNMLGWEDKREEN